MQILEPKPNSVLIDLYQVQLALAKLDLTPQDFISPALAGRDYRQTLTANNPSTSYSHVQGEIVRVQRDILTGRGFKRRTRNSFATTEHPRGIFQIATAIGTPETGVVDDAPMNAWKRGIETYRAMLPNRVFLSKDVKAPDLYVHLTYIDPVTYEVRTELAKPVLPPKEINPRNLFYEELEWRIIITIPDNATPVDATTESPIWTPDIALNIDPKKKESA